MVSVLVASDLGGVGVHPPGARALCHRAKRTHLAQELGRLPEDLGEGGKTAGLVAGLCQ